MPKPNPRLVDTPETAAIKPIDPTSSKKLVIENIDMPLDKYLESLGLGVDSSGEKTPPKKTDSSNDERSDSETRHTDAIDRINQKYGLRLSRSVD